MKPLSEQNLEHMKEEYQLISQSLGILLRDGNYYVRQYNSDIYASVHGKLLMQKAELEVKISYLDQFLNG